MTKIITIPDLEQLIAQHGMQTFYRDLLRYLKEDFARWDKFHKIPRIAAHVPNGIIELMPIWDDRYYSYKYVNGHPNNTASGHLTVVALGCLADIATGYPLLLSEMTVLTGIRTAATSALASDLLAKHGVTTMAVIGTGAQSEFQVLAHRVVRPIDTIRYFDLDPHTMLRFKKNMEGTGLHLIECRSAEETLIGSEIIVVTTAAPGHQEVVKDTWVKPGVHINGIGGDSPGKTELALAILKRSKIFVEFMPQTQIEGEIQQLTPQERAVHVRGELWELVTHQKKGRETDADITLYDSVGFALEDYSVLRLVRDLSQIYNIGTVLPIIPELSDPKNLISLLGGHHLS
ncbi:MAG: ornithine cyclodeaminase [Simkania sp.]|nr:ornithine cyclodeaminase [Simkania sp.]